MLLHLALVFEDLGRRARLSVTRPQVPGPVPEAADAAASAAVGRCLLTETQQNAREERIGVQLHQQRLRIIRVDARMFRSSCRVRTR
ncbi:hypothetical protein CRENBAI_012716 [Crenichthys baileyi]|uniref:Secreted protein n=1 Tax=Crenichthys baileyi TaxID=28760 RepID=A0AAV9RYF9_9TELE